MARAGLKSVVEIFKTQLKWMAVVWDDQARVSRLSFYNDSRKNALEAVREFLATETAVHVGSSIVARKLIKCAGQETTFSEIALAPCSTNSSSRLEPTVVRSVMVRLQLMENWPNELSRLRLPERWGSVCVTTQSRL